MHVYDLQSDDKRTLHVDRDVSIRKGLKRDIAASFNIDVSQQRLVFNGHDMDSEERTPKECGIVHEDIVWLQIIRSAADEMYIIPFGPSPFVDRSTTRYVRNLANLKIKSTCEISPKRRKPAVCHELRRGAWGGA